MTFFTENGYAVLTEQVNGEWRGMWGEAPLADGVLVPGTDIPIVAGVLSGATAALVQWHAHMWHTTVEPITSIESYDWRSKRGSEDNLQDPGSVDWSEHAAATAWDINAPAHPLDRNVSGRAGFLGFTDAQIDQLLHLAAITNYDGQGPLILAGGNWGDGMHTERNSGATDERIWAFLQQQGATSPTPPPPTTGDPDMTPEEVKAAVIEGLTSPAGIKAIQDAVRGTHVTTSAGGDLGGLGGVIADDFILDGGKQPPKPKAVSAADFKGEFATAPDDDLVNVEPVVPAGILPGMSAAEAERAGRP